MSNSRVIALGFFDGVHLGHRELLRGACRMAERLSAVPSAITFDVPPSKIKDGQTVPTILSIDDRVTALKMCGMEDVIVLSFKDIRTTPWRDFLTMLREQYNAVGLVCGEDFRFGHRGEGDVDKLRAVCPDLGLELSVTDSVTDPKGVVSSSRIRKLLAAGSIEKAAELLSFGYFISGTVARGKQLGRTIGFPTVNIPIKPGVLVPPLGVYATTTTVLSTGEEYRSVTNVGVRPTVESTHSVNVETYIFNYSGDLYGEDIRVQFHTFLRPEQRFEGVAALREQIEKDKNAAHLFFRQAETGR